MGTQLTKPNGAMTQREEFGATQIQTIVETASTAVAAREKAAVEARYVLAMRQKRNWDQVRVDLLKECSRPGFAATARYRKPIGKGVEGPSIRFAEAAIRCMTNVYPETVTVYDDSEKRILRQSVTDLEANVTYASEVILEKTVERLSLKEGQVAIRSRINSQNKTTYLVEATEDDLLNKQNALISKALRTNGLRLLPGDILEECMERVIKTIKDRVAEDPDAEKHKMIDAFSAIGVAPVDLQMYLGHPLERLQPAEIVELRGLYSAIREGETTWQAVLDQRQPSGSDEAAQAVGKLKFEKLKKEAEKTPPATETKPAEEQTKTEQQTMASAGPFASEDQQMTIMTLAGDAKIPQVDLQKILVKFGVLSGKLHEIPLDIYPAIVADLKGETAPRTEEAKPKGGLKFGEKAK